MRNGQLKPAYNVQLAVDSEYIVSIKAFQDRNDTETLIPMLKELENNFFHLNHSYLFDATFFITLPIQCSQKCALITQLTESSGQGYLLIQR